MNGERVRKRVKVNGQVQGVFFRDSTQQEAHSHGVAGWVTNEPDGSVVAVFEGEPEAVERMVEFCRSGPRSADVESVDVEDQDPEGLESFEVR
jgi:acylphosphatase